MLKKDCRNEKGVAREWPRNFARREKKTGSRSGRNFRAVFVQIHIGVSIDLFCTIFSTKALRSESKHTGVKRA